MSKECRTCGGKGFVPKTGREFSTKKSLENNPKHQVALKPCPDCSPKPTELHSIFADFCRFEF